MECWYFLDENSSLWIVLIQMLTCNRLSGQKCPREQKSWVKVSQPLTRRVVLVSAPTELRNGEKQCPEGRVAAVGTVLEKQCGEKEREGTEQTHQPHIFPVVLLRSRVCWFLQAPSPGCRLGSLERLEGWDGLPSTLCNLYPALHPACPAQGPHLLLLAWGPHRSPVSLPPGPL